MINGIKPRSNTVKLTGLMVLVLLIAIGFGVSVAAVALSHWWWRLVMWTWGVTG